MDVVFRPNTTTLETSGEDRSFPPETGGEDLKTPLEVIVEDDDEMFEESEEEEDVELISSPEMSGEDVQIIQTALDSEILEMNLPENTLEMSGEDVEFLESSPEIPLKEEGDFLLETPPQFSDNENYSPRRSFITDLGFRGENNTVNEYKFFRV